MTQPDTPESAGGPETLGRYRVEDLIALGGTATVLRQVDLRDKTIEQYGVKVMVDKKSYIYLVGTELEFSDGLNGKGFVFTNPNAKKSCGCGTSFSV